MKQRRNDLQAFLIRGACAGLVLGGTALAGFTLLMPPPKSPPAPRLADASARPAPASPSLVTPSLVTPSPVTPGPLSEPPAPVAQAAPPPAPSLPALRPPARHAARPSGNVARAGLREHPLGQARRHALRLASLPPPQPAPRTVVPYPPPEGPAYYAYYPRYPMARGYRYPPSY